MYFADFFNGFVQNTVLGSGVVDAFMDSNLAGKIIVVVLGVFSVWAWTVMIGKYSDLCALEDSNRKTESKIARSSSVFMAAADRGLEGPYAAILKEAAASWARSAEMGETRESIPIRMGHVENAIQRALNKQTIKYESKMVMLGSIVSGAPFLGLLGTVWGVMDSFGAVGMQASVTLQMLAPGVSGALLTTVAGLIVAIPSVFGYNFLLSTSRGMVTAMENYASSLADKIELESREAAMGKRDAASANSASDCDAGLDITRPNFARTAEPDIRSDTEKAFPKKVVKFSLNDDDDDK